MPGESNRNTQSKGIKIAIGIIEFVATAVGLGIVLAATSDRTLDINHALVITAIVFLSTFSFVQLWTIGSNIKDACIEPASNQNIRP